MCNKTKVVKVSHVFFCYTELKAISPRDVISRAPEQEVPAVGGTLNKPLVIAAHFHALPSKHVKSSPSSRATVYRTRPELKLMPAGTL